MDEFNYDGTRFMAGVLSTDKAIPFFMSMDIAYVMAAMHCTKQDKLKFKNDYCEGEISTQHKYSLIGTLGGVEYTCRIDFDDISATVRMILREQGPGNTELN